jgi:hypothetical protein
MADGPGTNSFGAPKAGTLELQFAGGPMRSRANPPEARKSAAVVATQLFVF